MWIILAILVVAALITFLIVAAYKPNTFRLQRSLTIKAAPETIYAHIDDFHKWSEWSPWDKLDPDMKRIYGGAASGTGATYAWSGNGKAGTGSMTIKEAEPASRLRIALDFEKPFKASNTAEFLFQAQGDSTIVSWAMFGPSPFMSKVMGTIFNMDALVGKDFEKGLQSLKALSEAA